MVDICVGCHNAIIDPHNSMRVPVCKEPISITDGLPRPYTTSSFEVETWHKSCFDEASKLK